MTDCQSFINYPLKWHLRSRGIGEKAENVRQGLMKSGDPAQIWCGSVKCPDCGMGMLS